MTELANEGFIWNVPFLLHGIAYGILPTLIPLYFIDYLKGSLVNFGVMSALAMFLAIMTSIYTGRLTERFRRAKAFIIISFLLSSVILFALTQTTDVYLFQALYILLEVSNSLHIPSKYVLIAETYQRADWIRLSAQHSLIVGLANTAGLAFCSLFVSSLGYKTLLFTCAPLMLASFIAASAAIKEPPLYIERWLSRISRPVHDVEALSYWLGSKGSPKRFGLMPSVNMALFGLGTLIFMMARTMSSAFSSIPIYLRNVILMAPSIIFAISMVRSLFGTLSYLVISKWTYNWGSGNIVKIASLSRSAIMLLFPSIAFLSQATPILAVILLSTQAFFLSFYSAGSSTIVMEYASEGSIGVYEALSRLGSVVGGLFSGLIPAIFGFNPLFIMASVLFFLAFIIFWQSI